MLSQQKKIFTMLREKKRIINDSPYHSNKPNNYMFLK